MYWIRIKGIPVVAARLARLRRPNGLMLSTRAVIHRPSTSSRKRQSGSALARIAWRRATARSWAASNVTVWPFFAVQGDEVSRGEANPPEQVLKTRVGARRIELRVNLQPKSQPS